MLDHPADLLGVIDDGLPLVEPLSRFHDSLPLGFHLLLALGELLEETVVLASLACQSLYDQPGDAELLGHVLLLFVLDQDPVDDISPLGDG